MTKTTPKKRPPKKDRNLTARTVKQVRGGLCVKTGTRAGVVTEKVGPD